MASYPLSELGEVVFALRSDGGSPFGELIANVPPVRAALRKASLIAGSGSSAPPKKGGAGGRGRTDTPCGTGF